ESSVDTLRIKTTIVEFLDKYAPELVERERMPLYIEDLYRLGDPTRELDPIERQNWKQEMDYFCIRIQLCRLDLGLEKENEHLINQDTMLAGAHI
ncbi:871_t:CDS:2, partial [Racocetra fulgida]